ncbi:RIP metalloprotease RseP [Alkalisalibacterium limincola]|uniref:Zinc metalloprotease n=1 Tax=Alkalisalibacterium limincola TaxID=2699169 RepID=A0A5C8KN17_9GAMM|nr:RIP metalloprotease RseP [Alkalisalibacterium limincola]TXK62158.1 RIP metalloprotease RseP [Alkalisalibacterium limincola]
MEAFFGSIWWLIVSLGILVTFHEFGHYWVARRCGVRVLRFSVGFGKPLWQRRGKDGTVYQVAAIPLGGYVKMLDEREIEVRPEDRHEAFNNKTVWQRIAIVAAGPGFNLILCLALLWAMFIIGKPDYEPLVGTVQGPAAEAGFEYGDRLTSVGGRGVDTWSHAMMALTVSAIDREAVEVDVRTAGGFERTRTLDFANAPAIDERNVMREIGLVPQQFLLEPVIGEVSYPDSPLRSGDRVVSIDGGPVRSWNEITGLVAAAAGPDRALEVVVERDGLRLPLQVRPQLYEGERWVLGITPQPREAEYDALLRYGPIDAIGAAGRETWHLTTTTFAMLWRMINGTASLQNLSGPITIAQYANSSAGLGVAWFLNFLALLSLSLAIINLLPIPILDGGHLLYYFIELIKGSPVSERTMIVGQYIGLAMLAGLMGLAFYNDILRLFGS